MIEDVFPIEHGDFPVSQLSFFRAESIASIPRHSTVWCIHLPCTCCVPRFIQKPFRFHVSNLQLQVVFPVADTLNDWCWILPSLRTWRSLLPYPHLGRGGCAWKRKWNSSQKSKTQDRCSWLDSLTKGQREAMWQRFANARASLKDQEADNMWSLKGRGQTLPKSSRWSLIGFMTTCGYHL